MNVEVFCLCDAATENSGKLNILGAFDTIMLAKVPGVHYQCAVVVRVRFSAAELGIHQVAVNFVDADGNHLVPSACGTLSVSTAGSANLILNLQRLVIPKFGDYAIDLTINGVHVSTLPLFVTVEESSKPKNC